MLFKKLLVAYKSFWLNTFTWKGTANRLEFWVPVLIHLCVIMLFEFVIISPSPKTPLSVIDIIYFIFVPVVLVPTFTLQVRRFHDPGITSWLSVLYLLPMVWILPVITDIFPSNIFNKIKEINK